MFALAISTAMQLDNCNPDVGMGPSYEMIAEDLAKRLRVTVSEADINEAVARAKRM